MKTGMLLLWCLLLPMVWGQAVTPTPTGETGKSDEGLHVLAIGEAELAIEKISILPAYYLGKLTNKEKELLINFERLLQNDFSFYRKRFSVPSYEEMRAERDLEAGKLSPLFYSPNYQDWLQKKTDYLIQLRGQTFGRSLKIVSLMFDARQQKMVYKNESIIKIDDYRRVGHQVADDIYQQIVKTPSIFNSKIFFVSDRDKSNKRYMKELYMMDFDGYNPVRLTHHNGLVISPAISPDGQKVIYSFIEEQRKDINRNVDLYMLNLQTKKTEKISSKIGINSGAIFFPDGENIALTLSHTGAPQVYMMNLKTKVTKPIITSGGINVDPSVSLDGKIMTFLSDRPSKGPGGETIHRPMIYKMDPTEAEKDVQQLSFVGRFHATPRLSPDGKEVVFASWVDQRFDLYRIDINGSNIVRLTKDFGSNENPAFSNDGQFIIFSNQRVFSQKSASFQLLIMDREGEVLANVSQNLGNCFSPRWTN